MNLSLKIPQNLALIFNLSCQKPYVNNYWEQINNSSNSTYCFLNFIQFGLTGEGGEGIIWTSTIINIYSKFVLVSVIFGYID